MPNKFKKNIEYIEIFREGFLEKFTFKKISGIYKNVIKNKRLLKYLVKILKNWRFLDDYKQFLPKPIITFYIHLKLVYTETHAPINFSWNVLLFKKYEIFCWVKKMFQKI